MYSCLFFFQWPCELIEITEKFTRIATFGNAVNRPVSKLQVEVSGTKNGESIDLVHLDWKKRARNVKKEMRQQKGWLDKKQK